MKILVIVLKKLIIGLHLTKKVLGFLNVTVCITCSTLLVAFLSIWLIRLQKVLQVHGLMAIPSCTLLKMKERLLTTRAISNLKENLISSITMQHCPKALDLNVPFVLSRLHLIPVSYTHLTLPTNR